MEYQSISANQHRLIPAIKNAYTEGLPLSFLVKLLSDKGIPDIIFKELAYLSLDRFSLNPNTYDTYISRGYDAIEGNAYDSMEGNTNNTPTWYSVWKDDWTSAKETSQWGSGLGLHCRKMAEILLHSFQLDRPSLLEQVSLQLVAEGKTSIGYHWHDASSLLLCALAKTISRSTADHRTTYTSPSFQAFFRNIIEVFDTKHSLNIPVEQQSWSRALVGCGCVRCDPLDTFLGNSELKSVKLHGELNFMEGRESVGHLAHLEARLEDCTREGSIVAITTRSDPSTHAAQVWRNRKQISSTAYNYENPQFEMNVWKVDHATRFQSWRAIKVKYIKAISEIGTDNLKLLLGERFDELMSLQPEKECSASYKKNAHGATGEHHENPEACSSIMLQLPPSSRNAFDKAGKSLKRKAEHIM